MYTVRTSRIQ